METITHATLAANTVYVPELPKCDLCEFYTGEVKPAQFDAKMREGGQWANMCMEDFKAHGIGLGTGVGQHLVLASPTATQPKRTKGRKWLTATLTATYRYVNCEACESYFDASTPDMTDEDLERGYPACWSTELDHDGSTGEGYARHLRIKVRRTRTARTNLKRTYRTNQH